MTTGQSGPTRQAGQRASRGDGGRPSRGKAHGLREWRGRAVLVKQRCGRDVSRRAGSELVGPERSRA